MHLSISITPLVLTQSPVELSRARAIISSDPPTRRPRSSSAPTSTVNMSAEPFQSRGSAPQSSNPRSPSPQLGDFHDTSLSNDFPSFGVFYLLGNDHQLRSVMHFTMSANKFGMTGISCPPFENTFSFLFPYQYDQIKSVYKIESCMLSPLITPEGPDESVSNMPPDLQGARLIQNFVAKHADTMESTGDSTAVDTSMTDVCHQATSSAIMLSDPASSPETLVNLPLSFQSDHQNWDYDFQPVMNSALVEEGLETHVGSLPLWTHCGNDSFDTESLHSDSGNYQGLTGLGSGQHETEHNAINGVENQEIHQR